MGSISSVFSALGQHKMKILTFFLGLVVFLVLLFPLGDLSGLATSKVAEMTNNQVFFHFGKLGLSFWPHVGVQFGDINVDSAMTGPLSATQLTIAPSPAALWSQLPYGSLTAEGLFRGDVDVRMHSGSKSEAGAERQRIEINASHLSLSDLRDLADLPVLLKGKLDVQALAQVDLSMTEQPEADISIHADKFEMPSQTINLFMGPINVPELRLSKLDIKGKLISGHLTITDGEIGSPSDDVYGKITGGINLTVINKGGFQTIPGPYSFDVDLNIKSGFEDRLSLFLGMVSQFKTVSGDISHYQFRASADNMNIPAQMSALH